MDLLGKKPDMKYPCMWRYKVFGMDAEQMEDAVKRVMKERDYHLTLSRTSRHKKYRCMNLDILVKDEQDRLDIFQGLNDQKAIILIL